MFFFPLTILNKSKYWVTPPKFERSGCIIFGFAIWIISLNLIAVFSYSPKETGIFRDFTTFLSANKLLVATGSSKCEIPPKSSNLFPCYIALLSEYPPFASKPR